MTASPQPTSAGLGPPPPGRVAHYYVALDGTRSARVPFLVEASGVINGENVVDAVIHTVHSPRPIVGTRLLECHPERPVPGRWSWPQYAVDQAALREAAMASAAPEREEREEGKAREAPPKPKGGKGKGAK